MINDLDKTLEMLLKQDLPSALVGQVTISFAMPDNNFPPNAVTLPALDIFLYDVRENLELRSSEWLMERKSSGEIIQKRAPVRVDCSYLITAWASKNSTSPAHDEHYMLGEAMKVLLRHPTIPPDLLQGSLQGQDPPLPAITLRPGRLQSMGEFWQALGGKPKAALNYTVTIGVDPFVAVQAQATWEYAVEKPAGEGST